MSKAIIELVANDDGTLTVNVEFEPSITPDLQYEDHPAAAAALSMLESLKKDSE